MRTRERVPGLLLLGLMVGCGGSTPGTNPATPTPTGKPGSVFSSFRGGVDETLWTKGENLAFRGNGVYMLPSEVTSSADFSSLNVHRLASPIEGKYYSGGTLVSKALFSFGTFTVRMRAPIPSGSTCSFFLMSPWEPGHWLHKEIDIEFPGKAQNPRNSAWFTVHRYYQDTAGPDTPACKSSLPFDIGLGFHEYAIHWAPDRVVWSVDGAEICRETQRIPDVPLNIYMNHWVYDPYDEPDWVEGNIGWLGPLNDADLPSHADYEWVRYEPL